MIIILLCVVGGAMFGWYSRSKELERSAKCFKPAGLGRVVYALKPIPGGVQIEQDSVEERALERAKVPKRAIPTVGFAVGRKARHHISLGQIIEMSDLDFEPTGQIKFDTSGSVDY